MALSGLRRGVVPPFPYKEWLWGEGEKPVTLPEDLKWEGTG